MKCNQILQNVGRTQLSERRGECRTQLASSLRHVSAVINQFNNQRRTAKIIGINQTSINPCLAGGVAGINIVVTGMAVDTFGLDNVEGLSKGSGVVDSRVAIALAVERVTIKVLTARRNKKSQCEKGDQFHFGRISFFRTFMVSSTLSTTETPMKLAGFNLN
jgi:hypothetical protein